MIHLIKSAADLPQIRSCQVVLDFETTSGQDKVDSLNPWHNCSVLGVCICVDNSEAWYVPVGHRHPTQNEPNIPLEAVQTWLKPILDNCEILVGHNIKYDVHVLQNCLGIKFNGVLYDTLTQAKLIDSDRLSYSLGDLSKDWLGEDISQFESAFSRYLYDHNGNRVCKDYGVIPATVLAPYGGQDVLTTYKLKKYIKGKLPEACSLVSKNEIALTSILLDIEDEGMRVDPMKVQVTQLETAYRLHNIILRIHELTGEGIRPHTTEDCYRFLCGRYGLPILEWTNPDDQNKVSNPSFNKNAMASYLAHPRVRSDPTLLECVELIQEYRTKNTFANLFLQTYHDRNINGVLHPSYNQCVRTGRLSCSDPNTQQLSKLAKGLIETLDDDWLIVDIDLSQIEFRLIASTINNRAVIERYHADPSTDYHALVASMANLERKPAKNLNFAVGFGAGKKKAISMVKGSLDISSQGYQESNLSFDAYCQTRAESMWGQYHRMLPELQPTMRKATNIARERGYISNLYGRHRRLSERFCYKAFNAYIQSSAADIAKHLTILIAEYISSVELVKLIGVVHDSWIFYMHRSEYQKHCVEISRIIRSLVTPNAVRVPILNSVEISRTNWAECKPLTNLSFGV